jgi:hypothetical protein
MLKKVGCWPLRLGKLRGGADVFTAHSNVSDGIKGKVVAVTFISLAMDCQ